MLYNSGQYEKIIHPLCTLMRIRLILFQATALSLLVSLWCLLVISFSLMDIAVLWLCSSMRNRFPTRNRHKVVRILWEASWIETRCHQRAWDVMSIPASLTEGMTLIRCQSQKGEAMCNHLVFMGNWHIQFFQEEVLIRDKAHRRADVFVRTGLEKRVELVGVVDKSLSHCTILGMASGADIALVLHLVRAEQTTYTLLHWLFLCHRCTFLRMGVYISEGNAIAKLAHRTLLQGRSARAIPGPWRSSEFGPDERGEFADVDRGEYLAKRRVRPSPGLRLLSLQVLQQYL